MIDWPGREPAPPPRIALADRALPLSIRRLAHARRMTLRLSPDGGEVRVTMPRWGRTTEAVAFATSRIDWLEAQLRALPQAAPLRDGDSLAFRGGALRIAHLPGATRRVRLAGGAIHVGGPAESLGPRLRRWLEAQALALLAEDLAHYCARAGVARPRLALSGARRRWGSCSATGAIRVNWRLVMAPDPVRRSVVAHEVAHLVHFDHSPAFHALLASLFEGDVAEANRWLRRHGRGLAAPFG